MGNRFPGFQGVTRAQEVERDFVSLYPKGETLVSFLSLTTDNAALSVVGGLCFKNLMMIDTLMWWLSFDTERAKLAKGRFLGAGRGKHFPQGVLELPYDLAREPWREARWR